MRRNPLEVDIRLIGSDTSCPNFINVTDNQPEDRVQNMTETEREQNEQNASM